MKNVLIVSALLLSATAVQAQPVRLVPSDGSELSALCIAAAASDASISKLASGYGISRQEIHDIRCNGIPLTRFAQQFKSRDISVMKEDVASRKTARK